MSTKEVTRDVIAILIVLGAIASMFLTVNPTGERLLQTLAGLVVGFYFGIRQLPLSGLRLGKRSKK